MTSVVVLSDTHSHRLSDIVCDHINACDLIIHAGDFTTMDYYEYILSFGKDVVGVMGNMDDVPLSSVLPAQQCITIEDWKIAVIHGWGAPATLEKAIRSCFDEEDWDILIYGHSHQPIITYDNEKIIFNPGSPTDKRGAPFKSFGLINFDGTNRPECSIIQL